MSDRDEVLLAEKGVVIILSELFLCFNLGLELSSVFLNHKSK
jgi:hypothetical protein